MSMTKACPGCKGHVPGAASKCQACGYDFGATIIRPRGGLSRRAIVFLSILGLLLLAGVLAAVLLPGYLRMSRIAGRAQCTNNLATLHKMMGVYAEKFGGHSHYLSVRTGSAFWLHLGATSPPVVDGELSTIFACPLRGRSTPGTTDYRGPSPNANVAAMGKSDLLGADKVGNHGFQQGGNVLRKGGEVVEVGEYEPLWLEAASKTAP